MKILLPYHLGCGNRGCEGIARGIAKILDLKEDQLVLFDISSYDYINDINMGLGDIGYLKQTKSNKKIELGRLICRAFQKMGISYFYNQLMSYYYVSNARQGDYIFITGGDIYCYAGAATLPNLIVKKAKEKGIKTVLFGASMEKKFLNEEVVEGLKKYDLIITRETMSAKTLTDLGLKNYLYPDPAFSLLPEVTSLPEYFEKEVVGINFSPFTDTDELFEKNMDELIKYILSEGMEVCFIPHVFWKGQDDRDSIIKYVKKYGDSVHVLNSEKLSYLQIRYIISKCKFFIGGRTHSVISAYSTKVPCIALGYSIKSRGIAKDIGMPEYTVVDSKNLKGDKDILKAFTYIERDYDSIKLIYENMENYIEKLNDIKTKVFD